MSHVFFFFLRRVVSGNFNENWAREIFCEAYKLKMYGKKYQWIIMGTYTHDWWKKIDGDFNCTLEELETALEQTLLTDLLPLSTSGEITISGIVSIDKYTYYFDERSIKNIFYARTSFLLYHVLFKGT